MSAVNTSAVTTTVEGRQWVVESRSQPGTLHVVKAVKGGLSCTCAAAINGRNCWHVASVAIVANADRKWDRAKQTVISEETRRAALAMLMGKTA